MSLVLPNVLNYNESLPTLPDSTRKVQVVVSPSNSQASYFQSQIIQFDLPQQAFMVPDSLQIRYRMTINGGTANTNGFTYALIGTPVYMPFLREEIIINSNVVESINGYNQIHNLMTNLKMSVAQKYGVSPSYGYSNSEAFGSSPSMEYIDGRLGSVAVDTFTMAAPLPCLLSYSAKLIPLGSMGSVRVQLTLDSLANIFSSGKDGYTTSTAIPLPSAYSISNIELVYDMLEFNSSVIDTVMKNERIFLKSQSFSNSQQTFVKSSGTNTMTFNTRLSSIKSCFINMSSTDTSLCVNKLFDSVDISKSNGEFSLSISGTSYPMRPYSTLINKNSIFQGLRDAIAPIFDNQNSLSISRNEWNVIDSDTTLPMVPGKFILGFNLEKIHNNSLLTGISSTQTAINFIMNLNSVPSNNVNINMILNYDVLLEIDLINRQCSIKQ